MHSSLAGRLTSAALPNCGAANLQWLPGAVSTLTNLLSGRWRAAKGQFSRQSPFHRQI